MFFLANFFVQTNNISKMFHQDYDPIIKKLPKSLVERSYKRLLSHSHHPVPREQIDKKNKRIEEYLQRTLDIYQKNLIQKRKKKIQVIEPPENLLQLYNMENKNTQTDVTNVMLCDYEEEINRRIIERLDILSQQLLKYNKKIVGEFIEGITKDYEQRIKNNNKKMRDEIERIREQLHEAEKCLLQSRSIHKTIPIFCTNRREFYVDAPEVHLNQKL